MARIRTIKPEMFGDEKLAPLDVLHRFVFVGLIGLADDAGRLLDSVRQLDGLLFPVTSDTCGPSLVALTEIGVIERGITASGQPIIQIVGWTKHQRVDKPRLKAALPAIKKADNSRSSNTGANPAPSRENLANNSGEIPEDGAKSARSDLQTFDLRPSDLRPATGDLRAGAREAEPPVHVPDALPASPPPSSRTPDPQPDRPTGFLDEHPDVERLLGPLRHPGGIKATAATIAHRFLFADDDATLADPSVKGLQLDERRRLVSAALLEYATQPEPFDVRFFAGFVRRLRGQPVPVTREDREKAYFQPDPTPEPTLEETRSGLDLVRQAIQAAGGPPPQEHRPRIAHGEPMPSPTVDPEKAAQLEQKKRDAKAKLEGNVRATA